MARIRSIHPALFTDEAFASLSMAARVLLLGLWTEADDQGVFDWKPITLKMRIMPVDAVSVPDLLLELEGWNAIKKFEQDGRPFGAIRNFCKFQRPKTPKYRAINSPEIRKYVASAYAFAEMTPSEPEPFLPIVEIPPQREEGGGKEEEVKKEEVRPVSKAKPSSSADFVELKRIFPKRLGDYKWALAERKFNSLVKTGVDPKMILAAARRLEENQRKLGNIGTQFVPMPASWLNSEDFLDLAVTSFEVSPDDGMIEVTDQRQLEAWDDFARSHGRPTYPRTKRGGWRFPSKWPPGYEANIAADVERLMAGVTSQ